MTKSRMNLNKKLCIKPRIEITKDDAMVCFFIVQSIIFRKVKLQQRITVIGESI